MTADGAELVEFSWTDRARSLCEGQVGREDLDGLADGAQFGVEGLGIVGTVIVVYEDTAKTKNVDVDVDVVDRIVDDCCGVIIVYDRGRSRSARLAG